MFSVFSKNGFLRVWPPSAKMWTPPFIFPTNIHNESGIIFKWVINIPNMIVKTTVVETCSKQSYSKSNSSRRFIITKYMFNCSPISKIPRRHQSSLYSHHSQNQQKIAQFQKRTSSNENGKMALTIRVIRGFINGSDQVVFLGSSSFTVVQSSNNIHVDQLH